MALLGVNCFSSRGGRGRGIAWSELFQFPGVGEAVALLGVNCFSSPGRARLWYCLG